jgi:cyclophilin family peptidyl-prolyl cis-trans isomerase
MYNDFARRGETTRGALTIGFNGRRIPVRPLLIVLAVVALGLALAFMQPSKDLTPAPADRAEQQRLEAQRQDQEKARRKRIEQGQPGGKPAVAKGPVVVVVMTVKGKGDVTMELYRGSAPKTVDHIVALIQKGFYNGIAFHRVIPNFAAQAGDPKSRGFTPKDFADRDDHHGSTTGLGEGGSGQTIPFENSGLPNEPGAVAMARSASMDSADSQFFINLAKNSGLDGDYCVFGAVKNGMDVVNRIARGDVIERMAVVQGATSAGGAQPK